MGVRTLERAAARRAAQPRPSRNNSAAGTLVRSRAEFVPLGRGRRGAARLQSAKVIHSGSRVQWNTRHSSFVYKITTTSTIYHTPNTTTKREVELLERDRRTIEPTRYL
ncbi:hypothetical protein J6590_017461 [Homalodisca vitripennis]|nr:hypothetical protein J6590_017461 [Homalodisca vitripennis]